MKFFFFKSGVYDVVILDELNSDLFEILTRKKKKLIIPLRNSLPLILNISFFIDLLIIIFKHNLNYKKIKKNYLSLLFKYIQTKKVLTFYENTHRIKLLKEKFPHISFFTFINGTRIPNYNFTHDNLITWGKIDEKIDFNSKHKSNNYLPFGSLRFLNYLQVKKPQKKSIDVVYISGFSTVSEKKNKNIFSIYKVLRVYEAKILKILSTLKKKHKYNIKILMKNENQTENFEEEKLYLENFFTTKDILIKKKYTDSYEYLEKSKIVISLISALGLEALSLDTRVLLGFSLKKLKKNYKFWKGFKYYSKFLNPIISIEILNEKNLKDKIYQLMNVKKKNYLDKIKYAKENYSMKPNLSNILKEIYKNK